MELVNWATAYSLQSKSLVMSRRSVMLWAEWIPICLSGFCYCFLWPCRVIVVSCASYVLRCCAVLLLCALVASTPFVGLSTLARLFALSFLLALSCGTVLCQLDILYRVLFFFHELQLSLRSALQQYPSHQSEAPNTNQKRPRLNPKINGIRVSRFQLLGASDRLSQTLN
jgi:hypothetical protein